MKYGPQRHHRRSIRLQGYDYAQAGAYFVTVCAYNRECLFGEIMGEEMQVNASGEIVIACWHDIPRHFANVELDAFVVMPNHIHGIIMLRDVNDPDIGVGAGFKPAPTLTASRHGLPEIVRAFKTFSARRINELRQMPGVPVWQRNYYEHIIRNEKSLHDIRRYIQENPLRWAYDRENPANTSIRP